MAQFSPRKTNQDYWFICDENVIIWVCNAKTGLSYVSDAQKSSDMSSAARCLLAEPSFDIDNIKFLLGESESKSHQKHGSENEKTFSLENCKYI